MNTRTGGKQSNSFVTPVPQKHGSRLANRNIQGTLNAIIGHRGSNSRSNGRLGQKKSSFKVDRQFKDTFYGAVKDNKSHTS